MKAANEPLAPHGGWQDGFFPDEPPSFPGIDTPAARIGVVDVGSNSVRMVVYEGDQRSPAVLFNEKVMCALGASLAETGALDLRGKARALAALNRYAAIGRMLQVGALAGVATAAVRDASDGAAFCDEVEAETGIRLKIASGADEARLAAQGVIFGSPTASGVVVDLGGASMELCRVEHGRPGLGITTPLGPLRLRADSGKGGMAKAIAQAMRPLAKPFRLDGGRLYLVGGSWRALAKAQMERMGYPLKVLHEFTLTAAEALELADWAAGSTPAAIAALPGVSEARAPVLPMAGRILRQLVTGLRPGEVMVSGFGLREGVCLEHLPAALRHQDPLMAACEAQEQLRARAPGFGPELAAWVAGFLPAADVREARLVAAAARLVDVNWRSHPDYRAIGVWETVTRPTITDVSHAGRVFMGAILVTRYKRARKVLDQSGVLGLLDRESVERAARVGAAFRLAAVLAGSSPGVLPHCSARLGEGRLELVLGRAAGHFAGEEVERRLRHLAADLKLAPVLRIEP